MANLNYAGKVGRLQIWPCLRSRRSLSRAKFRHEFSSRSLCSVLDPMLPRNLQNLVVRSAIRRRAVLSRQTVPFPPPFRILPAAGFHSSSRRQDEVPKSPFQTFVEVLRDELKKNRELQENVKQLQGDVDKFQDSEAMKRARAAYEKARVCSHILVLLASIDILWTAYIKYQRKSSITSCS